MDTKQDVFRMLDEMQGQINDVMLRAEVAKDDADTVEDFDLFDSIAEKQSRIGFSIAFAIAFPGDGCITHRQVIANNIESLHSFMINVK